MSGILRGKPNKPYLCIGQKTTLVPNMSTRTRYKGCFEAVFGPSLARFTMESTKNRPKNRPKTALGSVKNSLKTAKNSPFYAYFGRKRAVFEAVLGLP